MKNSDSIFNTFDPEMVKKFKPETWYDKVSGPTISFHRFFVLKDFDPDWILVFKEIEKYNMAFVISEANYCFEHKKIKNIHHHA